MNRLTTNDVAALAPGEAQYSTITDADGILLDDTVVYRLPEEGGPVGDAEYLFVPNAGHDAVMVDRWRAHADQWDLDVAVENATEALGMIAVQGPDEIEHLETLCEAPGDVDRFTVQSRAVADVECLLARTGYTGEDGVELLFDDEESAALWSSIECQPCGLGARDTLRLEAGFVLSGREFDPETNPRTPYEADLGFVVDLNTPFVGRDALGAPDASDPDERLVGFRLLDRGIARNGHDIVLDGATIGTVTSGTMSPTLGEAIGLGYVPAAHADPGTELGVSIRDETRRAIVVERPFL
jgi:aminomethyltransferase